MSRLVAVLPLKPGARGRAEALLREGPPFDLEQTQFDRHQVFLTDREVVFVFEGEGPSDTVRQPAEDPALWKASEGWQACLSDPPRVAVTAYSWERSTEEEGVSFTSTPGPGDSEGGELYSPS
ncbi:MAG: hypothetical protein ACRDF0_11670 [Candidatus Limnocylindria bacterium]